MRFLMILSLALIPSLASATDLDPAVLLELAKAKRLREAKPVVAKRTLCECAATGRCTCFDGECVCAACNKAKAVGGAAVKAPKAPSSATPATPVRPAATPAPQATAHGSSAVPAQSPERTSMSAIPATLDGTIEPMRNGCQSGNCPAPSRSRFGFRR